MKSGQEKMVAKHLKRTIEGNYLKTQPALIKLKVFQTASFSASLLF